MVKSRVFQRAGLMQNESGDSIPFPFIPRTIFSQYMFVNLLIILDPTWDEGQFPTAIPLFATASSR